MDKIRDRAKELGKGAVTKGKGAVTKTGGFLANIRKFVENGSVMDLAVGVILGAASRDVVFSFVSDIFGPVLGMMGTASLEELFWVLRYPTGEDGETYPTVEQAQEAGAITLNYGVFLQSIINFGMVAFCLFLFMKLVNFFKSKATHWPCPKCRETVKEGAIRCPHCTAEPIFPEAPPEDNVDGPGTATSAV